MKATQCCLAMAMPQSYVSGNIAVEVGPRESHVMLQTDSRGQSHTFGMIAALLMQHDADASKRSQGGSNSRP